MMMQHREAKYFFEFHVDFLPPCRQIYSRFNTREIQNIYNYQSKHTKIIVLCCTICFI